ncbi:hypothetical protein [Amycolatopsis sp. WQ 127309]|uniref:hypothetical protein n=1 Tax=Amycolatopsis sp. WQ 127309 TaxID=2932773 RepID=UPI001FF625D4|nr:hypothetical protein [Amycolatopsis sp. WQ 127309]UOZ07030.1 hypothetical protein MUY22_01675 [Amycolatopsis sp. WQ 127309]
MAIQANWASCAKCQGMHYAGFPDFKGVCPAGGAHEQTGSWEYRMLYDLPGSNKRQAGWASCAKCQGLHYAAFPEFKGACPAGGAHEQAGSWAYDALFETNSRGGQRDWRSCRKCQGLFYGPFKGKCPADGSEHDPAGSFNYFLIGGPDVPDKLTYHAKSITFSGGTALGGWALVTLFPDGNFEFSGHLHNSGAAAYEHTLILAVPDAAGQILTFRQSGNTFGTLQPGPRDCDWKTAGHNDLIATSWNALTAQGGEPSWRIDASVNWGAIINALVDDIAKAAGYIGTVVSIVG